MIQSHRRIMRWCKTLTVISVTLMCWIGWLSLDRSHEVWKRTVHEEMKSSPEARTGLAMSPSLQIHKTRDYSRCIYIDAKPKPTGNPTGVAPVPSDRAPGESPRRTARYPEDLFTLEERRHGWILLHISAMIYLFFALVIVCEEFLVPALRVLTEKLQIPVAGLNVASAGGFTPEFFICLIGLFLSSSHVGVGVVVGSGLFNVLAVMGTCVAFSDETLALSWWPLCRDVIFYTGELFILLLVLLDNVIRWWECVLLLMGCAVYVTFIKYNETVEEIVKLHLQKHNNITKVLAIDEAEKCDVYRGRASDSLRNCTSRKTVYQLILDAPNPLTGVTRRKHAGQSVQSNPAEASRPDRDEEQQLTESESSEEEEDAEEEDAEEEDAEDEEEEEEEEDGSSSSDAYDSDLSTDDEEDDDVDTDLPLSLKWPEEKHHQVSYVLLFPISVCLWLTLADPRRQASKQYFIWTLIGSLLWIALFSYFILCLSHWVSETAGVSEEMVSLTMLSAGVSSPNLITALIRANDASALSNSVGINVFDISVGLAVSWLTSAVIRGGSVMSVGSNGLIFIILLFVITLISGVFCSAALRWRISRGFGRVMLVSYFLFLFLSVLIL